LDNALAKSTEHTYQFRKSDVVRNNLTVLKATAGDVLSICPSLGHLLAQYVL
jgi:hypothetical protein